MTHPVAEDIGTVTLTVVTAPDGADIVAIRGDLDIATAPAVRERLLSLLRPGACRLVIDMSAVRYADASGLAVLVSTQRRAALLGGELRLAAPRPEVARILTITGISRNIAAYPTVRAAMAGRKHDPAVTAAPALPAQAQAAQARAGPGADCRELHAAVAAGFPRPCAHWRRPMRAPASRPWSRPPGPCWSFSAGSRSPTRPSSPRPPLAFAGCSPPGGARPWASQIP